MAWNSIQRLSPQPGSRAFPRRNARPGRHSRRRLRPAPTLRKSSSGSPGSRRRTLGRKPERTPRSSACARGWRRYRRLTRWARPYASPGHAMRRLPRRACRCRTWHLARRCVTPALQDLPKRLWKEIPDHVLWAPSLLTPGLLAQLEELAGTNATLRAGVDAWRTLWNARLKLHDIAEAIRQSGKLRGITTTNLWIEQGDTRWLCVLNPDPVPRWTQPKVSGRTRMRPWTLVRFLPKSVAERSLVRALTKSEVKLPDYLGLAAWLEGEPLTLPERWSPRPGHQFRAFAPGRSRRAVCPTSASSESPRRAGS